MDCNEIFLSWLNVIEICVRRILDEKVSWGGRTPGWLIRHYEMASLNRNKSSIVRCYVEFLACWLTAYSLLRYNLLEVERMFCDNSSKLVTYCYILYVQ